MRCSETAVISGVIHTLRLRSENTRGSAHALSAKRGRAGRDASLFVLRIQRFLEQILEQAKEF